MSALDSVLADLIEADSDCPYATIKREPLEALIDDWMRRGVQVTLLCGLLTQARYELTQVWHSRTAEEPNSVRATPASVLRKLDAAITESASTVSHHRHAVRRELAARLKQVLRSAIAEVAVRTTEALLAGNKDLAERLESERQTVRMVMSAIDAVVDKMLLDELTAARCK